MLMRVGWQLMIAVGTVILVAGSALVWPLEYPDRELAAAGARLCYANDETLLIGVRLEGPGFGDAQVEIAGRVTSLQRLSLANSRVTGQGIQGLLSLSKLTALDLSRTQDSAGGFHLLPRISSIRELRADGCDWLNDEHLQTVAEMPNLETVSVARTSITADGIKHLIRLPRLRFLSLDYCPRISDSSIEALTQLCSGRRLDLSLSGTEITTAGLKQLRRTLPDCMVHLRPDTLSGLREIADRGTFDSNAHGDVVRFRRRIDIDGLVTPLQPGDLAVVTRISTIAELNLEQSNVDDSMLLELQHLPQLTSLRLSGTRITDAALASLAGFPNLTSLWLSETSIVGPGLEHLKHVPLVTSLKIQIEQGDEMLKYLAPLHNLEMLTICAPISDEGAEQLARHSKLTHLTLRETCIRGPGIVRLSNLPLTELRIDGGLIDDSDVESIASVKTLRLVMFQKSRVTRAGRERLLALRPDITFHRAGDVIVGPATP